MNTSDHSKTINGGIIVLNKWLKIADGEYEKNFRELLKYLNGPGRKVTDDLIKSIDWFDMVVTESQEKEAIKEALLAALDE